MLGNLAFHHYFTHAILKRILLVSFIFLWKSTVHFRNLCTKFLTLVYYLLIVVKEKYQTLGWSICIKTVNSKFCCFGVLVLFVALVYFDNN